MCRSFGEKGDTGIDGRERTYPVNNNAQISICNSSSGRGNVTPPYTFKWLIHTHSAPRLTNVVQSHTITGSQLPHLCPADIEFFRACYHYMLIEETANICFYLSFCFPSIYLLIIFLPLPSTPLCL